ncbi:MAG TPA: hypothetical protein VMS17_20320 [Gemmataceae bacterium]|nr:hypothetical protein [Gemmataceae bacterium]
MSGDVFLALAMVLSQAADPAATLHPAVAPPPAAPAKTPAPPLERLKSFDTEHAFVDWSFQGWQVSADGATIKDFGRNESEAREALRLIRELRLDQRGVIGGPAPALEYWLSDGKPPQGSSPGLRVLPIDGASLRVEQMQDQWMLRDDHRALFSFGGSQKDAKEALAVIQKYGFTQVGTIGAGAPSMMVFFAGTDAVPGSPPIHATPPPVPDPASPAAKPQAKHTGLDSIPAPAVPPLRGAPISGNGISVTSDTPDHVPFDWRQVQLHKDGGDWKLAAGSFVLADFGSDEYAARLGRSAVQYYHFTEQRQVGDVTYYLCGGQAPRGLMFGMDGQAFEPDRLQVRQIDGKWAVCTGDVALATMGDAPEPANQLLDVIQRQHFDHICRLGKGMTFFVRSR